MRKMNDNITIACIRTRLCIKLLRIYLLYKKKKHKWKEIWQCIIGSR